MTGLVQPLNVVVNAPFKAAIKRLAAQHMQDNLDAYMHRTIPVTDRRVLLTEWVGVAWEHISKQNDVIIRSFTKCGISVPIGSKDDDINIKELDNYTGWVGLHRLG